MKKIVEFWQINQIFVAVSKITGCVSISACASLFGVPIGVTISAIGLEICAITEAIKKYNSIIQKKNKKHDEIVLLAKTKLNSMGLLISKIQKLKI